MDLDPRSQNAFLASLGADDFEALRPHLRTVTLVQSRLLVTVGDSVTQAYLPHGGVISLVVRLAQGERVEVAMIGRDSVLNLGGVLAGPLAVSSAVVLLPGYASVIDVEQLRGAAQRSLTLRTTTAPIHRTWRDLLPLVASGRMATGGIFTHHFPLEQASDAYAAVAARSGDCIKTVFDVS